MVKPADLIKLSVKFFDVLGTAGIKGDVPILKAYATLRDYDSKEILCLLSSIYSLNDEDWDLVRSSALRNLDVKTFQKRLSQRDKDLKESKTVYIGDILF